MEVIKGSSLLQVNFTKKAQSIVGFLPVYWIYNQTGSFPVRKRGHCTLPENVFLTLSEPFILQFVNMLLASFHGMIQFLRILLLWISRKEKHVIYPLSNILLTGANAVYAIHTHTHTITRSYPLTGTLPLIIGMDPYLLYKLLLCLYIH